MYFQSPLPFLKTPSATRTTDKAKVWHVIKMLRGNFIWTHKPEHLLMKAGARINKLRQPGSLSKTLISHTIKQPFRVGAQRASTVTSGSSCFPELAISFIHTALMNTPKLRTGQIWIQDKLRSASNCSHSFMLTFQRVVIAPMFSSSPPVAQLLKWWELEVVMDGNVPWLVFSAVVHYLVCC